jgi:hypothetical protein
LRDVLCILDASSSVAVHHACSMAIVTPFSYWDMNAFWMLTRDHKIPIAR